MVQRITENFGNFLYILIIKVLKNNYFYKL